jgi:uncharacterized protein YfdQ (DUF2303 family)
VNIGRTQSLIDYANRYKDADSLVYARGQVEENLIKASATIVFNPHPIGSDQNLAGYGDFKAEYNFPLSKELLSWLKNNGNAMAQMEFANFLEDHVCDMTSDYDYERMDLEKTLGGKRADPIEMLELSRGLELRVNEQVKNVGRLQSGEMQIVYSVEHTQSDGQPIRVPTWFNIKVPVFEGDAPHIIPVRLRYRVKEGKVIWFYELFSLNKIFDAAFDSVIDLIKENTQLPVFIIK